jgi:hypothetical protein
MEISVFDKLFDEHSENDAGVKLIPNMVDMS